jgi:hypothetical protein
MASNRSGYSDYSPGYSTANDFSGQEPVRGRLHRSEHREHRGSGEEDQARNRDEDHPRNRAMNRRSDYPETYRSAMSGYMSEHVGADRGRQDYNQNPNEGNLYGGGYGREGQRGIHRGKGPRNYRRTDDRIQEDINDRLTDDPRVDASEVNVKVENGEVTLTGTVDDRKAKRRAEDIAESVPGVTHVENLLRVHSPASTNPGFIVKPY